MMTDKINDKDIVRQVSKELDIDLQLVEGAVSSFFSNIAKTIANNDDVLIEVKHLGKFQTKKTVKHGNVEQ